MQALPAAVHPSHWLTPDGFKSLVALVGTNGQGVGTSPLSEWVKKVSTLTLPPSEKQTLDIFIDKLYDDLEEGNIVFLPFLSFLIDLCPRNRGCRKPRN